MDNKDHNGWSKEPIEVEGKQYFHKSGFARLRGDLWYHPVAEQVERWVSSAQSKVPVVLLKPVEPEPCYPTPDQFFKPDDASALCLPNRNADSLRRQLESGAIATRLLYKVNQGGPIEKLRERITRYCLAREKGLPWPEEDQP